MGSENATAPSLTEKHHDWVAAVVGTDPRHMARANGAQAGNSARSASSAKSASHAAPANNAAPASGSAVPAGASPVNMKEEEIAAEIMDHQVAILEGWKTALNVFDKTMTSAADAETSPNFQKAVTSYLADKLIGGMLDKMKQVPGVGEAVAIAKTLAAEVDRASAAAASAKLRDFIVGHAEAVGALAQSLWTSREPFIAAVRAKREEAEAPAPAKGKAKKSGAVDPTQAQDEIAMIRMVLMDTLDSVDAVLRRSTSQALFRELTEEWVRNGTVQGGMGTQFGSMVIIRLNPDYSLLSAHIQGSGGQKLAEQLVKDFPDGVDLMSLKAPREIKLMADNGWPSAILDIDANNHDISNGSLAAGDSSGLYKHIMSKGLPKAKKMTGD
jgi:hypothetical protein